ncbi:DUF6563 family protein [Taibaiella chishuiensis]|uniref:Uncharacterized protein n=1 Tax=Taibaiella chishuiensis TaxID=1434707 RepID=A0A2P8CW91_9BACT|nr:DUF6563 family protein [Taibaiella chishuiensis]PSK89216.1 hypothetical protein B0I18_11217 [Taibaiella chishuiensis]
MKTRIRLFLLCCLYQVALYGQRAVYTEGVYSNIKELKGNVPFATPDLAIIHRSQEQIDKFGGNNYNIFIKGDSASVRKIGKKYFAVSDGKTLFLNCRKLGIGFGFTDVLASGRYLAFKAYLPQHYVDDVAGYGALFGFMPVMSYPDMRRYDYNTVQFPFLWTLDIHSGRAMVLTYGGMLKLLESHAELKEAFINEKEKGAEEMMLLYIRKLNAL